MHQVALVPSPQTHLRQWQICEAVKPKAYRTWPGARWCLSRFSRGLLKVPRHSLAVPLNHHSSFSSIFQVAGMESQPHDRRWQPWHIALKWRQCNKEWTCTLTYGWFLLNLFTQDDGESFCRFRHASYIFFSSFSFCFNCWENQHWNGKSQGKRGAGQTVVPAALSSPDAKQQPSTLPAPCEERRLSICSPRKTTPTVKLFSPALHMHWFIFAPKAKLMTADGLSKQMGQDLVCVCLNRTWRIQDLGREAAGQRPQQGSWTW